MKIAILIGTVAALLLLTLWILTHSNSHVTNRYQCPACGTTSFLEPGTPRYCPVCEGT